MQDKFSKTAGIIIRAITLLFVASFAVMGFLSQVKIDITERVYLSRTNILVFGVLTLFAILLIWGILKLSSHIKLTPNSVFIIFLVLGVVWILVSQVVPTDDSDHCFKIAEEIVDGITHSFDPGQYMDVARKQQSFLVLYMCLLTLIGGAYNYILFEFINAVLFAWLCREVFTFLSNKNKKIATATMILVFVYAPIWMSVTYVYGNLPGMVFGIIALIKQYNYLEDGRKADAVWASIFIGIAVAFKMFTLIFLITMIIMYVWKIIIDKKVVNLMWVALCLVCYLGIGFLTTGIMNLVTDNAPTEYGGMPMTASIVMGLDIDEEMTNPGWYTAYNIESYMEAGNNKKQAAEMNKRDLKAVVARASANPVSYIKAMFKKNHTVWNDSTFDILYRMRLNEASGIDDHAYWYNDLMADSGRLHRVFLLAIQALQVAVYIGVILYAISMAGMKKYLDLSGLIAFIGGVLLISIWEAKSEYVTPFFVPLFVYSLIGYEKAWNFVCNKTKKNALKTMIWPASVVLISAIVTLIFMPHNTDVADWNAYIDEHYYVSTDNYSMSVAGYSPDIVKNVYLSFDPIFGTNWAYTIYDNTNRYYFKFLNWDEIDRTSFDRTYATSDNVLTILDDETINGDFGNDHWVINRRSGGYLIRSYANRNKVWTYDEQTSTVILADYEEGNMCQIWQLN